MDLINNQYRVLREDKNSLLIRDLADNQQKTAIIIEKEFINDDILDFFAHNYTVFNNINSSNILKSFDFGIVKKIDGKPNNTLQYFMVSEYVGNTLPFEQILRNMSEEHIVKLFADACRAAYYLHVKGMTYNEICCSNVLIIPEQTGYSLKFKDLAEIMLNKRNGVNDLYFKAPEVLYHDDRDKRADIYSLGVLLFRLATKAIHHRKNFKTDFDIFKQDAQTNPFYLKLLPIIEGMTAEKSVRYKCLISVMNDLNQIFNTQFSLFSYLELDCFHLNTPLVGRVLEKASVFDALDKVASGKLEERFIFFHGEFGSGKTSLLTDLFKRLSLKGVNVYSSFNSKDGAIKLILKQLLNDYNNENKDGYDLIKYINSYVTGVFNDDTVNPENKKLILKFIYDCIMDKPSVFIIDDLDAADAFTLETLERLMSVNKKIIIVCSYENGFRNEILTNLIDKHSRNTLHFDLQAFNLDETALLIKQILSLPNTPIVLANAVYKTTGGNPLFIAEVIKSLHINKTITLLEQDGTWHIDHEPDDYAVIPMPASIRQAAQTQADKVNAEFRRLLEVLCIFNIPVFAGELAVCLETDESSVIKILNSCVKSGIVLAASGKAGTKYSFTNSILKDYLYKSLDAAISRKNHNLAAEALINDDKFSEDIVDEIIFHLEKAERNDETLIKYLLANSKKYENLYEHDKVIENLIKAITVMEQCGMDDNIPEIMFEIVRMYSRTADTEKLNHYLKMAADFVCERDNLANKAIYLSKCAYINHTEYFEKAKALFDEQPSLKTECLDAYLGIFETQAHRRETDHYKKIEIYDKIISMCNENNFPVKPSILVNLGLVYYFNNQPENALKAWQEAKSNSEKTNDCHGCAIAMFNIAELNATYFYNKQTVQRLYSECTEYTIKHRLPKIQLLSQCGLLQNYMSEMDYRNALPLAEETLLLSKMINNPDGILECNIRLHSLYMFREQYIKAYEHSLIIEEMLVKTKSFDNFGHEETVLFYFEQCIRFALFMGDNNLAQQYFDRQKKFYNGKPCLNIIPFAYGEMVKIACFPSSEPKSTTRQVYAKIKELTSKTNKRFDALNIILDFILILERCNCLTYLGEAVNRELTGTDDENLPMCILAKLLYLRSLNKTGKEKHDFLLNVRPVAEEAALPMFMSKLYCSLGEYYRNLNRYKSLRYFALGCQTVQEMVNDIPEQFKRTYITIHKLLTPFEQILSLNNNKPPVDADILDVVYNKDLFTEILSDEKFIESARESYLSNLPVRLENRYDTVKYLGGSPEQNLSLIANYLAAITYATRCEIVTEGKDGTYKVIASNDGNLNIQSDKRIFIDAKTSGDVFIKQETGRLKAAICFPAELGNGDLLGYIYLHTNSVFNNFNQTAYKECKWFSELLAFNIHLYETKQSSLLDKLTGALNRQSLEAAFDSLFDITNEAEQVFSIILIDLDLFKSVNDNFGHQTGDDVLRSVGKLIKSNTRKDTIFGRYGGEEFILILDGASSENALDIANKLRRIIENAKLLGTKQNVTASMGISTFPLHDTTKAGLIEKADKALYVCKHLGRNQCAVWNPMYTGEAKSVNTLGGLITGDSIKDGVRIRTILDMIELVKYDISPWEKAEIYLSKISEMTDAETGLLLTVENGIIKRRFAEYPKRNSDKQNVSFEYDIGVIEQTIESKESFGGNVGKKSVICSPVIKEETVLGVLYFTVTAVKKKFLPVDVGFVNYLCGLMTVVL